MADETANEAEQRVSEIASSLIALLDVEEAKLAELHEKIREIDNRRARLKRAVDALQRTERAKAAKAKKKSSPSPKWAQWTPKEASIEQLHSRVRAAFGDEPFTVREAMEASGLSSTLSRKVLEILHERGEMRRAGVRKMQGGEAMLFATMPSAVPVGASES